MRIVGKGKSDYYDSCMGYGQDPNLCYVRNPVEHDWQSPLFEKAMNLKMKSDWTWRAWKIDHNIKIDKYNYELESGLVGFCGKVYAFIRVDKSMRGYYPSYNQTDKYFYTEESLIKYLKSEGWKGEKYERSDYRFSGYLNRERVRELFETVDAEDFFFDIGNPVWSIQRSTELGRAMVFIENPCLKELQFYKVFDSFSAYQELSMFLGGVMGEAHPPTVAISDEEMKVKKGFGHKYAFKKEPEGMK